MKQADVLKLSLESQPKEIHSFPWSLQVLVIFYTDHIIHRHQVQFKMYLWRAFNKQAVGFN